MIDFIPLEQHEKDSSALWRYMSFTKYVALLRSRSLFLPRGDRFIDAYEGYIHNLEVQGDRTSVLETAYMRRKLSFVSCWHKSKHESEAMWSLYANSEEGVAVCSHVSAIAAAVLHYMGDCRKRNGGIFAGFSARLADVAYIDDVDAGSHESAQTDELLFIKRRAFEHEREMRLVVSPDHAAESGWLLPIDLGAFIDCVVVSPRASNWFKEVVSDVSSKYGIDASRKIKSSLMAGTPDWEAVAENGEKGLRELDEVKSRLTSLFPRPGNS